MTTFQRGDVAGQREGWRQTLARYKSTGAMHLQNANDALDEADRLLGAGRNTEAAGKFLEAQSHYMKLHGAEKGQEMLVREKAELGQRGMTEEQADVHRSNARQARTLALGAQVRASQADATVTVPTESSQVS